MNEFDPSRPRFYFSLLRLMTVLRGADATRAETNGPEAWMAGVAMYLISFQFFAQFVPVDLNAWLTALAGTAGKEDPLADGIVVKNPISADYEVMRTSLLPWLVDAAKRNLARGIETRLRQEAEIQRAQGSHRHG